MKRIVKTLSFSFVLLVAIAAAVSSGHASQQARPTWKKGELVPLTGRPNPLGLSPSELDRSVRAGKLHALQYPIEITGTVAPYNAMVRILDQQLGGALGSADGVFAWLGLSVYPATSQDRVPESPYAVPFPAEGRPDYRMGVTLVQREDRGFTLSCAACHSGNLFGRPVLGLTNRFPRANEFYFLGKQAAMTVPPQTFRTLTGATPGEMAMYDTLREHVRFIGPKMPQLLGLDSSVAHVSLSLSHRGKDGWATKDPFTAVFPRDNPLNTEVADSKPAVWWNVKYKNRWGLDGTAVSGNPLYMVFLWNEIGRGTDLHELENWWDGNQKVIDELTSAVFATQAPRFTDFMPAEKISLERAKRGEVVFNQNCAGCHGTYLKAWNQPRAWAKTPTELLATTEVRYHETTPVIDVGTDPGRYIGMRSLAQDLNRLIISQNKGVLYEEEKGYVPPPLVGIWARWPYFHNNSAPSLCAVLTRSELRPKRYTAGPAEDPALDFDVECNGYPSGANVPGKWVKNETSNYDTSRRGLSNSGHDVGIFVDRVTGKEILTPENKTDLISFLQTL